jgi:hypothetical protein
MVEWISWLMQLLLLAAVAEGNTGTNNEEEEDLGSTVTIEFRVLPTRQGDGAFWIYENDNRVDKKDVKICNDFLIYMYILTDMRCGQESRFRHY